jgi:hypothetical protein
VASHDITGVGRLAEALHEGPPRDSAGADGARAVLQVPGRFDPEAAAYRLQDHLQPHGPHPVQHGVGTISQTCLVQVVNHVVAMRCGLTPSHPFYIFFLTMEIKLYGSLFILVC